MAELIDFGTFTVNFLRDKHDTQGGLDMFELTTQPKGKMPVPHYHDNWDETVYGVEGVTTYVIDGVDHHIGPGESAYVPRKIVHGFDNRSDAVAKCLCILTPGVLGPEYFRELAEVIRKGKPDPAVMKEIMSRYGLIPAPPAA